MHSNVANETVINTGNKSVFVIYLFTILGDNVVKANVIQFSNGFPGLGGDDGMPL